MLCLIMRRSFSRQAPRVCSVGMTAPLSAVAAPDIDFVLLRRLPRREPVRRRHGEVHPPQRVPAMHHALLPVHRAGHRRALHHLCAGAADAAQVGGAHVRLL